MYSVLLAESIEKNEQLANSLKPEEPKADKSDSSFHCW